MGRQNYNWDLFEVIWNEAPESRTQKEIVPEAGVEARDATVMEVLAGAED